MKEKPWTKYWLKNFKNDRYWGQKRFKRLENGYPHFEIDESLIDNVSFDDFIKIEEHRIPLFIGSQFGINPRIDDMSEFFNGRKLVAILEKSLLSGQVYGLTIYGIEENVKKFDHRKLISFKNN